MAREPLLYRDTAAEIRQKIERVLAHRGWRARQDGAGHAMINLFGYFAEVITSRLNRVPEQHLRAFLNEAEIERLPARPARTELTFTPVPDGDGAIKAPAGVQVATRPQGETPEIVFETERDLVVVPTSLDRCIAVDPVYYSDRSAAVRGEKDSAFAIFAGDIERDRILYVGHDALLTFPDEPSRKHATVVLDVQLEEGADPAADGGWRIEWLYWNDEESQWLKLIDATQTRIDDETHSFSQSGEIRFRHLPLLGALTLDGVESVWLACRLTGGGDRSHLPAIKSIQIFREIWIPPRSDSLDFAAVQSVTDEGPPGEPDRELFQYIGHDRLLSFPYPDSFPGNPETLLDDPESRERCVITLSPSFEKHGESEGNSWQVDWLFWDGARWADLKASGAIVEDRTSMLQKDGFVRITGLPLLQATEVNGRQLVWLAAHLRGVSAADTLPIINRMAIRREIPGQSVPIDVGLAAIQAGIAYVPLELEGPFMPLGPAPQTLDTFYLQVDEAFTKPGATVTIELVLEGMPEEIEDTTELEKLRIEWEYSSTDGWTLLGRSRRGCPALAAYDFEGAGLVDPAITTRPLTRTKFIEFPAPDGFTEARLVGRLKGGKILTDVYTGERFVQFRLPDECKGMDEAELLAGCYEAARLNFRDTTCAFTTKGRAVVQFDIPLDGDEALFAPAEVNGETGYWVRARLGEGGYTVPQKIRRGLLRRLGVRATQLLPPSIYPPVVEQISVQYSRYYAREYLQLIDRCVSKTDAALRNHAADLAQARVFRPFTTSVEMLEGESNPALYVGFNPLDATVTKPAFPQNEWIQLRVDVDEDVETAGQPIQWEYWDGQEWAELRMVDETLGLTRSGYLGFFAPHDHAMSVEFGASAYWLRIRPNNEESSTVQDAATADDESGSKADIDPRLKTLRLNTVPAINAETIVDEIVGSSNGEPYQRFTLLRSPILSDIILDVLEPEVYEGNDPGEESASVGAAELPEPLFDSDRNKQAHEQWVTWRPVSSFYGQGPDSRCYRLDPINGEILFGDGKRGKIPPAGVNNIRVLRYRIHNGSAGNLDAGLINVLRNASSTLSEIQNVTNLSPALGGLAPETVEEVKRRGPQSLKHRQRPVMAEDFQWISLEADNVERAYCLPTRDASGKHRPGWVTIVIVPQSTEKKPTPSSALLRKVRRYLEDLALANLRQFEFVDETEPATGRLIDVDQIHVQGPQYMTVSVHGEIVPTAPERADEVKLEILQRLERFMHPLTGGPGGEGWQPGRDVHISEVAAEIEHVPGVDHVATLSLVASDMQQAALHLSEARRVAIELPAGSVVGAFDERVKFILGKALVPGDWVEQILAYGFKSGDRADIVTVEGEQVAPNLEIGRIENGQGDVNAAGAIYFSQATNWPPAAIQQSQSLILQNESIRQEIVRPILERNEAGGIQLAGVVVGGFSPGDLISIAHPDRPSLREDFLPFDRQATPAGLMRIHVPHDHLVSSGAHNIQMALGV